ncbi:MAG TPA: hypothetical protein VE907_20230 [Gammaproteobacteria bacterium]|nr:hypothetical protein [Gammaproteobacteria bacterium]
MLLARSLLSVLLAATTACAQQGARQTAEAGCALSVIVAFASPPDDALLADLGRGAGVRLEGATSLTTNIYSLTLRADGAEAVCRDAVQRLRADPRVRSVDLDERRQIQAR